MDEKLTYFAILGALIILGYPLGCFIAKSITSKRVLVSLIGLVGAVVVFVGIIAANDDHRFRLVAEFGVCLQVASLVATFKIKRTVPRKCVDLWASTK